MAGKSDILDHVAGKAPDLTRKQVAQVFDAVFDSIGDILKSGDSAKVPGFGSFAIAERPARKGRNPATGEAISIKASKSVRFKPGKELKESVNKKGGRKK
jgi:DNA-binding protein HU-beta